MGGIPPTAGQQFVLVSSHFSMFWLSMGSMAIVTLVLLAIQVILLGISWFFLIWLLVREFQALRSGAIVPLKTSFQLSPSTVQPEKLLSGAHVQQAPAFFATQPSQTSMASQLEPVQLQSSLPLNTVSGQATSQIPTMPMPVPQQSFASTGLSDIRTPFDALDSENLEYLPPVSFDKDRHYLINEEDRGSFFPAYSLSSEEHTQSMSVIDQAQIVDIEKPRLPVEPQEVMVKKIITPSEVQSELEISTPMALNNPFDVQPNILNLFPSHTIMIEPIVQSPLGPIEERAQNHKQSLPSGVSNKIIEEHPLKKVPPLSAPNVFDATSPVQLSPTASNMDEDEDDDEDPFVFGNPFSGPLPDVFHQDSDLRRSVLEQTGHEIEEPAKHIKPKKKRPFQNK